MTNDNVLGDTQDRYTPDPGKIEGPVRCGVCKTEMSVRRNVNGPRGFVQAMSSGKSLHDVFSCPHSDEEWHRQVVALRREATKTASKRHGDALQQEAEDILDYRQSTKKPPMFS